VGHHLSAPNIAVRMYLPTHQYRRQLRRLEASRFIPDLCGISACKVYPNPALLRQAVSSYLTFSPLPAEALAKAVCPHQSISVGSYSLWHYLFPINRDPDVIGCIALCCPDFPTQMEAPSR
jgi:hypothetical protein